MFFGIPRSDSQNLYVVGVAWDGGSSYRKGSSSAPQLIRQATSHRLYNSYTEGLTDLRPAWRYQDLGDVSARSFDELASRLEAIVASAPRAADSLFLFLGGDHSITIATVRALRRVKGDFGLVYLDAHPDMYSEYDGDPYSHACVVRRIVELGLVDPGRIVVAGVRAPTPEQAEFARGSGVRVVSVHDLAHNGIPALGFERAYVSIDLDVLDPAFAPGVGNPEPGGLSTRELVRALHGLEGVDIVGFDIVEYNPRHDHSMITAFAAAKIIRELLGLAARRNSYSLR